jgi:hypothetical protein
VTCPDGAKHDCGARGAAACNRDCP